MGIVQTRVENSVKALGYKVDPNEAPKYSHTTGPGHANILYDSKCAHQINAAMSNMKVSTQDASSLQHKLQNEYFSKWTENIEVQEYSEYSFNQIDMLLHKLSGNFNINGVNIYTKLCEINFAGEVGARIYEFNFGQELNSGEVRFGMVAISKGKESIEAISCLYTLDFALAEVKRRKNTVFKVLGIPINEEAEIWFEKRSLGFVTQKGLENFCRVKALKEFKARNIISSINDVHSLKNM